jgi:hypothetical protein
MPVASAYLAAAFALVAVGLLLLASALLMALVPRLRPLAKRIALGVPGSAIGLLAFQLAAFPVVLAILWTFLVPVGYLNSSGGVTTNSLIIALLVGSAFLTATAFFGIASLGGLVFGWRAANALSEGVPLRSYLGSERIWQLVATAFRRPYRLPLLLWLLCVWSVFGISASRCWLNSGATVAEVPGVYRATAPFPERNVLDIKADGSWEYRRETDLEAARAGRWEFEPAQSDQVTVVISFEVKSGSRQDDSGPLLARDPLALTQPGFVHSSVSRDCAGKLLVCFGADEQICYERQSETVRNGAAMRASDRLRTSDARPFLRLTPPATCRL